MWKWLAGGRCLYSLIVAYFGTTKVCGHSAVVSWQTADAIGSGISAVAASSQLRLNIPARSL